nr:MAG TPA: hypothetical protein [Caudoviricetes sp.]
MRVIYKLYNNLINAFLLGSHCTGNHASTTKQSTADHAAHNAGSHRCFVSFIYHRVTGNSTAV